MCKTSNFNSMHDNQSFIFNKKADSNYQKSPQYEKFKYSIIQKSSNSRYCCINYHIDSSKIASWNTNLQLFYEF